MIVIHAMEEPSLPRLVAGSLIERLGVMPAVVVTGPRQAGKSTLVQDAALGPRRYLSLDDIDILGQVRSDPEVLLGAREALTLDEVQREPDLLLAVKFAIDRQRRKGRFLLTGSANLRAQPTVHRWLNLLETSYMVVRLPAFAVSRTKRLIKSSKLYFGDCGVALHLLGGEPTGAHLENLVLLDLLAWREARLERAEVCYWRTATGEEVDIVVGTREGLLPIEIKSSGRPRLADCASLRSFRAEYGAKALPGLLVHTGTTLEWLADDVLAVPWWRLV